MRKTVIWNKIRRETEKKSKKLWKKKKKEVNWIY